MKRPGILRISLALNPGYVCWNYDSRSRKPNPLRPDAARARRVWAFPASCSSSPSFFVMMAEVLIDVPLDRQFSPELA